MSAQLDMFGTNSMGRCHRCGYEGPGPRHDCKPKQRTTKRPSIEERFESFHRANPHVIHELLALAHTRLVRGDKRIGLKALWEDLRIRLDVIADGGLGPPDGKYKLDNSFTALYARKMIEHEPQLAKVIELRTRKAKAK